MVRGYGEGPAGEDPGEGPLHHLHAYGPGASEKNVSRKNKRAVLNWAVKP